MKSVEYLMVGEEAQAQVVVGQSLMNGGVDRGEVDVVGNRKGFRVGRLFAVYIAHLLKLVALEYLLQAACLLLAVGKDVQLVAPKQIVFKRLGKQLEVLVKQWLRRDIKGNGCLWGASRLRSKLDDAKLAHLLAETHTRNKVVLLTHITHYLLLFHLGCTLKTLG